MSNLVALAKELTKNPSNMPSSVVADTSKIAAMITDKGFPEDDWDHHIFMVPLKIHPDSAISEYFSRLLAAAIDDTKGRKGPNQIPEFRRHWQYVLLNLARSIYCQEWTVVSMTAGAYSTDYWLKKFKLSYRHIQAIVHHLEGHGLVKRLQGKPYHKAPMRTRLYPTPELRAALMPLFFDAEQPIEPPYVTLNHGDDLWSGVIETLDTDHPDVIDMTKINEFLKNHTWACKGPVRLAYKYDPFSSGRLITAYQNLPDRKIRLRINTLLNGAPLCEVDFNANHLRLNLACLHGEDAGETPYEDIAKLAGIASRAKIKQFITVAMGADASGKEGALSSLSFSGITAEEIQAIEAATVSRYPKLSLFKGWGIHAQSLEGAILRDVMLQGVDRGIPTLPVHDAIAVNQDHADWARDAMLEAWARYANCEGGTARTRVKVDYPD